MGNYSVIVFSFFVFQEAKRNRGRVGRTCTKAEDYSRPTKRIAGRTIFPTSEIWPVYRHKHTVLWTWRRPTRLINWNNYWLIFLFHQSNLNRLQAFYLLVLQAILLERIVSLYFSEICSTKSLNALRRFPACRSPKLQLFVVTVAVSHVFCNGISSIITF